MMRMLVAALTTVSVLSGCDVDGLGGNDDDNQAGLALAGGGFETTTPTVIRRRPRAGDREALADDTGGARGEIELEPVEGSETSVDQAGPIAMLTPACAALATMWTPEAQSFEDQVLALTNEARAQRRVCGQYGVFEPVGPVMTNEALRCAARAHTIDMVNRAFFDHTSPDGDGPAERALEAGYDWIAVGENIAAGSTTPRDVVDGWLESPGHCQNIMSDSFTELGVGYSPRKAGPFRHFWTQVFGDRAGR
ncbi:MAG: CAP domain-containing protein [Myxococcota bacterium]|nr:CAP domain-containing protein [Myxococcota bacterium]